MESTGDLLKKIVDIFSMGTANLTLKIIVSILAVSGFIFGLYLKGVFRRNEAKKNKNKKIKSSKKDNVKEEKQNSQDGKSIRNRLRRK